MLAEPNLSEPNAGVSAAASERRWYVVRLRPQQEAVAEDNLRQQRFAAFIPRTLKTVKHARKNETRKAPLFPGYGFVELDLTCQRWRAINGTRGVLNLIKAREQPIPVPRGVVEELLAVSNPAGLVDLSQDLAIGDEVRFRAGPFAGARGLLMGLDDSGRVDILLRIMSGQVRLKAMRDMLEMVSPNT